MNYRTVEEYLNEEVRRPIKYFLKDAPEETKSKVMSVVDWFCDRYREAAGTNKFYERNKTETSPVEFHEWGRYMNEQGYLKPLDYDAIPFVFTNEEFLEMLDEEGFEVD